MTERLTDPIGQRWRLSDGWHVFLRGEHDWTWTTLGLGIGVTLKYRHYALRLRILNTTIEFGVHQWERDRD